MILASLAKIFNKRCPAAKCRPHSKLLLVLERLEDRTVPSTLLVPSLATPTITSAVAAAHPGDTIKVAAGDYTGEGTITLPAGKPRLELEGPQDNNDPATASHGGRLPGDPTTEAVVKEFLLAGNKQEVSGFTITDPSFSGGDGIVTQPDHSGYQIEYNIFTRLGKAIKFSSNSAYDNQVTHNWFDSVTGATAVPPPPIGLNIDGNAGQLFFNSITGPTAAHLGPIGQDIDGHEGQLFNADIEKNLFSGMTTDTGFYSVDIAGAVQTGNAPAPPDHEIDIEHNTFDHAGNSNLGGVIRVSNATDAEVAYNTITQFAGEGIQLTLFLDDVQVSDNHLTAGPSSSLAGIDAHHVFGPKSSKYPVQILDNDISGGSGTTPGGFGGEGILLALGSAGCYVYGNNIRHMSDNGIMFNEAGPGNTIKDNVCDYNGFNGIFLRIVQQGGSTIANNSTNHNGGDGIAVDKFSTGSTFKNNNSFFNGMFDYQDDTHGRGTAGTGNTWIDNKGNTAKPSGILTS